jgi:hypothetical protein
MAKTKRVNEKTPNGGAYSIAYFQDSKGDPVDESQAVRAEIVEYNSKKKAINRTYTDIKPKKKK